MSKPIDYTRYFTILTLTPTRATAPIRAREPTVARAFPTFEEFSDENTDIFQQDRITVRYREKVRSRDTEWKDTEFRFERDTSDRTDQQRSETAFVNWVKTHLPITADPPPLIKILDLYRKQTKDKYLTPSIARTCQSLEGRVRIDDNDLPPDQWATENESSAIACQKSTNQESTNQERVSQDEPSSGKETRRITKDDTELKARQRTSAEITNEKRKEGTEKKIREAVAELEAEGRPITKAAVARQSGLSRPTIDKYQHLLKV